LNALVISFNGLLSDHELWLAEFVYSLLIAIEITIKFNALGPKGEAA
jgi:hypothetical protein